VAKTRIAVQCAVEIAGAEKVTRAYLSTRAANPILRDEPPRQNGVSDRSGGGSYGSSQQVCDGTAVEFRP